MRLCYFAQSAIQTSNIGLNSRNYIQSESLTTIIKEIDLKLRFDSKIQKMDLNFWFDVKIQTNWFDFVFSQEKQSGQHLQVIFNIFVLARKIQISILIWICVLTGKSQQIDLNLCFDVKLQTNCVEPIENVMCTLQKKSELGGRNNFAEQIF